MARGWTAGLLALVFVLGGCLGDGEKKTADPDGPLTVYVSLPLRAGSPATRAAP